MFLKKLFTARIQSAQRLIKTTARLSWNYWSEVREV